MWIFVEIFEIEQTIHHPSIYDSIHESNRLLRYHGYWAADFYGIDPHLGTAEDLKALSAALHARGMLLMLDVVANHVGPVPLRDR